MILRDVHLGIDHRTVATIHRNHLVARILHKQALPIAAKSYDFKFSICSCVSSVYIKLPSVRKKFADSRK